MRIWFILAGLFGAMAVGFGAYGAHGLAADPVAAGWVERASTYQLVHAVALALAADRRSRLSALAALFFAVGVVLFSGSLYARALGVALPLPMVTPAGGMAFIIGWLCFAASGVRSGRR